MGSTSSSLNQLEHSSHHHHNSHLHQHQQQQNQGKNGELASSSDHHSQASCILHPRGVQTLDSVGKKKRNLASLATLKKRLVRRNRRGSKSFDHGQILRDFLSGWSTRDLLQLVEEYESTALLKELHFHAENARPAVSNASHDLADLYDFKYAADTYLIFRGVHFPVHKALVCVRCPFFRDLLGKINTFGARVQVNSLDQIPGLRPEIFNDLLRYLYSGELAPSSSATNPSSNSSAAIHLAGHGNSSYEGLLLRLSERFGVPNDLDRDMKHLLETGLYSDASLCFSGSSSAHGVNDYASSSSTIRRKCRACSDQSEFSCHSAILASRSPFFKNVVLRHQRRFVEMAANSEQMINTANQKIKIILDESIIPRRFARVILHAMYRDSTDILSILPACVCKCALLNHPSLDQNSNGIAMNGPVHSSASCTSVNVPSNGVPGSIPANSMNSLASSATLTSSIAAGLSSHSSSLASFSSAGLGPSNSRDSTATSPGPYMNSCSSSTCSTSSGNVAASYVKEIMDLYEIARFLDLNSLIQTCEDLINDALSLETLVTILKWSEEPYGSPWVKRQALNFLRDEFSSVASSSILHQLETNHLLDAVKSSFAQASELEILQAVIKYGENKLLKKMEEREPNLISQTNHSLRRNTRKREMNDSELRDIISELMGRVRIGHIIPLDSEVFNNAVKRGLIATLPQYMVGEDGNVGLSVSGITSWLRGKGSGPFQSPRYFTPYVEEAKAYLEERLRRPGEMIPRRDRSITIVPDLYMVDSSGCPRPSTTDAAFNQMTTSTSSEIYSTPPCCPPHSSNVFNSISSNNIRHNSINSCAQAVDNDTHMHSHSSNLPGASSTSTPVHELPVIEQRILVLMKQREAELKASVVVTHAMIPDRCEISRIIQLRVVREFGLPDIAAQVLHNTASYIPYPATETESATDEMTASYGITGMAPSSGVLSNIGSNGALQSDKDIYGTYPCNEIAPEPSECDIEQPPSPIPPPLPPISDSMYNYNYSFEDDYLGGSRTMSINGTMPDIALATSALAEMHLHKRSTESLAVSMPPPPSRPVNQSSSFHHPNHSRSMTNIVGLASNVTSSPCGSLADETMTLGSVRRRPSVHRNPSPPYAEPNGNSDNNRFTSSASIHFLT